LDARCRTPPMTASSDCERVKGCGNQPVSEIYDARKKLTRKSFSFCAVIKPVLLPQINIDHALAN
jgi:hypothetical protein